MVSDYRTGHIKRNPDTLEVAIRMMFSDDPENPQMARLAWLIGNPSMGARNAPTSEVDDWPDVFIPLPPAPLVEGEVL